MKIHIISPEASRDLSEIIDYFTNAKTQAISGVEEVTDKDIAAEIEAYRQDFK
jgi:hypothetical protein